MVDMRLDESRDRHKGPGVDGRSGTGGGGRKDPCDAVLLDRHRNILEHLAPVVSRDEEAHVNARHANAEKREKYVNPYRNIANGERISTREEGKARNEGGKRVDHSSEENVLYVPIRSRFLVRRKR